MKKEIWISVRGTQSVDGQEQEPVEHISAGEYYHSSGKHYVFYEEWLDGHDLPLKNRVRIAADQILIRREGAVTALMYFQEGRHRKTMYQTPYGQMQLGILTHRIFLEESDDRILVRIEYALDTEGAPAADCRIEMEIRPRESSGR